MPFRRYARWNRIPIPCVASWRHPYCLLGVPLLAPEHEDADRAWFLEGLLANGGPSLLAGMDWVPSRQDAVVAPPGPAELVLKRFSRAVIERRPQADYLEGRVRGKHRREFRRLARGLEEELGGELEVVDRSTSAEAVETFLDLEAAGWKGRAGTALACDPGHATFFREAARAFAARGALELLFLEAAGRVAAARCSFRAGDASFCFKLAFDEGLARFSPGRELELRVIERFHDQADLRWMDSCAAPDNEIFNRLWPDRRELVTVARPRRGPVGRATRSALVAALRVRERRGALDQPLSER